MLAVWGGFEPADALVGGVVEIARAGAGGTCARCGQAGADTRFPRPGNARHTGRKDLAAAGSVAGDLNEGVYTGVEAYPHFRFNFLHFLVRIFPR